MEKREKIILVVVALLALYGAYAYLGGDAKVKTVSELVNMDELNKVKKSVEETIQKDPLTELEQYRFTVSEKDWSRNVFYERSKDLPRDTGKKPKPGLPQGVTLTYNGYVSIKGKIYAILNGMEYLEGEELEIAGFFVKKITPKKVIVGQKDEKSEITDQIEVTLEDINL